MNFRKNPQTYTTIKYPRYCYYFLTRAAIFCFCLSLSRHNLSNAVLPSSLFPSPLSLSEDYQKTEILASPLLSPPRNTIDGTNTEKGGDQTNAGFNRPTLAKSDRLTIKHPLLSLSLAAVFFLEQCNGIRRWELKLAGA